MRGKSSSDSKAEIANTIKSLFHSMTRKDNNMFLAKSDEDEWQVMLFCILWNGMGGPD